MELVTTRRKVSRKEAKELITQRVRDTFNADPTVTITLKGTEYTLEFNNWAVKNIYREKEVNLLNLTAKDNVLTDPEMLGYILWQGLLTHHPDLTEEVVDRLITYRLNPYICDRLGQALHLFLPDVSDIEVDVEEQGGAKDPTSPQAAGG